MTGLGTGFVPASMAVSFGAGLLTSLSPCVLPLLPIVVGGAMQRRRSAPLLMGIGMTVAFAVAGVMLGALGPAMGIDAGLVHRVAAFGLIVFGLALLIEPLGRAVSRAAQPVAASADRLAAGTGYQSPATALFFGGLLGLAWTPCAGPMLAATLALVASGRDGLLGGVLLGLFGMGTATPLVLAAYASRNGYLRLSGLAMRHGTGLRHGFGVVAMVSGGLLASGLDKVLAERVLSVMPTSWLEFITRY